LSSWGNLEARRRKALKREKVNVIKRVDKEKKTVEKEM